MPELDDIRLLREYVNHDSGEAFAELVARHVNKVYSVAMRHTRNPHQAEEITQAVFVILAKKARVLDKRVILSGWLYQTARLAAVTFIRGEIRRARREQEAHMQTLLNEDESDIWPQIAPLLDAAMDGLNETDRQAVVLRYFDGLSMKEIGGALGASEDAAKVRLNRAVEKLRQFFKKRGIVLPAAVLTAVISANSVQAAPAALAKTATAIALAKGAVASGPTLALVKGALKLMAWTKTQTAIVSAVVVGMAALSVVQYQAQLKLRAQNKSLQLQLDHASELAGENQKLSDQLAQANSSEARVKDQLSALLRQRNREQRPGKLQSTARPADAAALPGASGDNELPKSSWANAGFATPQAALQSRGWAVLSNDRDLFKKTYFISDDARKFAEDAFVKMAEASNDPNKEQFIQQILNNKYGVEEGIMMPMMAENQNNIYTGYKILSQQSSSDDEMTMEVETDMASASPKTETLKFERFGDDWKVVIDKETMQKMMK